MIFGTTAQWSSFGQYINRRVKIAPKGADTVIRRGGGGIGELGGNLGDNDVHSLVGSLALFLKGITSASYRFLEPLKW